MGDTNTDLRSDLISGDPARQSTALMAISTMLATGRDVTSHVALACQLLGNANISPAIKCFAYDFILAAAPTDADWARTAASISSDIQKGAAYELRVKALTTFNSLPAHHIAALLKDPAFLDRFLQALRHPMSRLKGAAIFSLGQLCTKDAVLSSISEDAGVAAALHEGWAAACDALLDDDDATVGAACGALSALLDAARMSAAAVHDLHADALVARDVVEVRRVLAAEVIARYAVVLSPSLSRFRRMGTAYVTEAPALLIAYLRALQPSAEGRPLDALPGDPGPAGAARAHAFEEATAFMADMLSSIHPAAIITAAEGLFQLAQMDSASSNLQALLPAAINAVVSVANATDGHRKPVTQPAVLATLLNNMSALPSVQRALLLQRLPPIIATVPYGTDRTTAFMQLWTAAVAHDWAAAISGNGSGGGGRGARNQQQLKETTISQVQTLLSDQAIKNMIAGTRASISSEDPSTPTAVSILDRLPHPRYAEPVFREEFVATLLYVLLNHPRADAASVGTKGVAAASSAISEASQLQTLTETVAWLAASKQAMQGTKACLGWDRVTGLATTGSTAVVDLWLQLLLKTLQLIGSLKAELSKQVVKNAPVQVNAAPGSRLLTLAQFYRKVGEQESELQGLLLQIITNWRALHPVVRCRAVWVCIYHFRLKSVVDAAWSAAADAIRGLLLESRYTDGSSGYTAAAQGALSAKGTGNSRALYYEAAAAAAANEQVEVALLCLERLASMVSYSNRGKLEGRLAPVASLLDKVVKLQLEQDNPPTVLDRLTRIQKVLAPVATSGREKKAKSATENGNGEVEAPIVLDLSPDPAAPASAAYPLTLPTSLALFSTKQAARYRKFAEQLRTAAFNAAIQSKDATASGVERGASSSTPALSSVKTGGERATTSGGGGGGVVLGVKASNGSLASSGVPTLLQLADILKEGSSSTASTSSTLTSTRLGASLDRPQEVTGPSTAISLTLSHSLDPSTRRLRLHCTATNRTMERLSGVVVELIPGGPISSGRRPLLFRLDDLPAGESPGTQWDLELPVIGFGWPTVQASITLPATIPLGEPVMRCKPYNVSPLQLLAPPLQPLSASEFYQRWQALPYVAHVAAVPTERGEAALLRLLGRIEAAGLMRVSRSVFSVTGIVHAAYHGTAWSGETVACIVTGSMLADGNTNTASSSSNPAASSSSSSSGGGDGPTQRLNFHFGSETAEVIAHIQGHESELLAQLTSGLAVPSAATGLGTQSNTSSTAGPGQESEQDRPVGTFSFFRSYVASQQEEEPGTETEEEASLRKAEEQRREEALETTVLGQWQKMRIRRLCA